MWSTPGFWVSRVSWGHLSLKRSHSKGYRIFLTSLEFLHDFCTITYEILCPLPAFFCWERARGSNKTRDGVRTREFATIGRTYVGTGPVILTSRITILPVAPIWHPTLHQKVGFQPRTFLFMKIQKSRGPRDFAQENFLPGKPNPSSLRPVIRKLEGV